ncbi:MAG: hypothetical protein ACYTGO_07605 [Planctomycetota bacterium]|jgi:opacity protein-like surface antigen
MQRFLVASLALATCAAGAAQTTAPKGYETKPGDHQTFYLGMYAQGQFQFGDGTLRGTNLVVRRVSYRLDPGHVYSTSDGVGHSWTNVQLRMAYTDVAKMTNTWSRNMLTTNSGAPGNPTLVFNSAVTWPTVTGLVTSPPWGQHVDFPFARQWIYVAQKHDLLFDYQFRTGQMANNAAWGGRVRFFYYLDGVAMGPLVVAPGNWWPVSPFGGGCGDPAHKLTAAAHTGVAAMIYADNHPTTALRGTVTVRLWSYYTAPGAPVVQALGVAGKPAGVPVGARCNSLHVDLNQPVIYFRRTASPGPAYSGITSFGPLPYSNALAGLSLWAQGAWVDSKTAAFSLTVGRDIVFPQKPQSLPKKMIHASTLGTIVGSAPDSEGTSQTLPLLSTK